MPSENERNRANTVAARRSTCRAFKVTFIASTNAEHVNLNVWHAPHRFVSPSSLLRPFLADSIVHLRPRSRVSR